jgi:hypothetical protein
LSRSFDQLCDEIHSNVEKDRSVLNNLRECLESEVKNGTLNLPEMIEQIVLMSDSMTKSNAQLVELAKMRMKMEAFSSDKDAFVDNVEDIFDDIGSCFNESSQSNKERSSDA